MIAFLKGQCVDQQPGHIILNVHDVGYRVMVSDMDQQALAALGTECMVYTHVIYREDDQLLIGFSDDDRRQWFLSLIKINGVGPRLALAILGQMTLAEWHQCLLNQDIRCLTRVKGLGKKIAERLLLESSSDISTSIAMAPAPQTPMGSSQEAFLALCALGYRDQEARAMISASENKGLTTEQLIKKALTNHQERS